MGSSPPPARSTAGVHVYDTARWGAACVQSRALTRFTESRGKGPFDNNVVHAACSDGIWQVGRPRSGDRRD